MQKIKAFYYIFKNSISSFDYYNDLLKSQMSLSVKYYLVLSLIVALIVSIKITYVLLPQAKTAVLQVTDSTKNLYPEELVITISNGEWSINVPEPLIIPLPEQMADMANSFDNLLVLDKEGEIDDLDNYNTLMLINSRNLLVKDTERVESIPLENLPEGEFEKTDFEAFIDNAAQIVDALPSFIGSFIFILASVYFVLIQGSYVLTVGIIAWLLQKLTAMNLAFQDVNKIAIHTATIPYMVLVLTQLAEIKIPFIGWFSLLNLILTLVVINKLKSDRLLEGTNSDRSETKDNENNTTV